MTVRGWGRKAWGAVFAAAVAAAAGPAEARQEGRVERFDVVIAGGSTAAFAAAVASAESGARTALIEPTDWVGGQLTSSGVPAVDEAWHKLTAPNTGEVLLDVARIARTPVNMTPNFREMLAATGNPGRGWVSRFCFEPGDFLRDHLEPLERRLVDSGGLVVYRDTVIKRVEADAESGLIRSITAIRRMPKDGVEWGGFDRLLSEDLADWYSPEPSDRFGKELLTFTGPEGGAAVFVEATEWGEVLVLADAPYLQGVEDVEGGVEGADTCGQATVIDFVQRLNPGPVEEPRFVEGVEHLGLGSYGNREDAWSLIWTYRRIKGNGQGPTVGDLSLQNWGYSETAGNGGNDYPFRYLFVSKAEARSQAADWEGGIDVEALAGAERRAYGWHRWLREHPPEGIEPGQVTLAIGALGTGHGLAKLPYIRDTRRSVGLGGYVLTTADLTGPPDRLTGTRFEDRVALGAYPIDIHPMVGCDYPDYVHRAHQSLPFYIPFRALTNERYGNLLVAGKTMAQSFLANAATRLHPIEWSTGTAAGVAAADMARTHRTTAEELEHVEELQGLVREKTPIEWTIDGKLYPEPGE